MRLIRHNGAAVCSRNIKFLKSLTSVCVVTLVCLCLAAADASAGVLFAGEQLSIPIYHPSYRSVGVQRYVRSSSRIQIPRLTGSGTSTLNNNQYEARLLRIEAAKLDAEYYSELYDYKKKVAEEKARKEDERKRDIEFEQQQRRMRIRAQQEARQKATASTGQDRGLLWRALDRGRAQETNLPAKDGAAANQTQIASAADQKPTHPGRQSFWQRLKWIFVGS